MASRSARLLPSAGHPRRCPLSRELSMRTFGLRLRRRYATARRHARCGTRPRPRLKLVCDIAGSRRVSFDSYKPRRVAVVRTPAKAIRALSDLPVYPGPRAAFDLQLVATMKANSIGRIYTFDTGDFEAFSELAVLTPSCWIFQIYCCFGGTGVKITLPNLRREGNGFQIPRPHRKRKE